MARIGRPLTYHDDAQRPVSVSLRLPRSLADQAQQYAYDHRCSLSALLIDGLTWRLRQGDPHQGETSPKGQAGGHAVTTPLDDREHAVQSPGRARANGAQAQPGVVDLQKTLPLNVTPSPQGYPPFDPALYTLGRSPCRQGHTWGMTGRALIYRPHRHCAACRGRLPTSAPIVSTGHQAGGGQAEAREGEQNTGDIF